MNIARASVARTRAFGAALATKPPVAIAVAVQRRYSADDAGMLGAAITYNAFLSIFPLLLLTASVVGFLLTDPAARASWIERLTATLPGLKPILGENLRTLEDARATTGILGSVSLLWTGTNVVRAAGAALDRIFGVRDRHGLASHAWAIGSLVSLGAALGGSVAIVAAISSIGSAGAARFVLALVVGAALDVGLMLISYRILTQGRGPAFRSLWPGAILAGIGFTMLKAAGVWYVTRTVAHATAIYGTFSATVGMLVILSFAVRLFLYGAELDVVLSERARGSEAPTTIDLTNRRDTAQRARG